MRLLRDLMVALWVDVFKPGVSRWVTIRIYRFYDWKHRHGIHTWRYPKPHGSFRFRRCHVCWREEVLASNKFRWEPVRDVHRVRDAA